MTIASSRPARRRFLGSHLLLGLPLLMGVGGALACNAILGIEDVGLDPRFTDGGLDAAETGGDPACAPSPREDPRVIREGCGIFVRPDGDDSDAEGARGKPVRTLRRALELAGVLRRGTVFLCATAYTDTVVIGRHEAVQGIRLYGALSCDSWKPVTEHAIVKPSDPSKVPLRIDDAPKVTLDGIDFVALDAVGSGASSIAAYVSQSDSVTIRNASLIAGIGIAGSRAPDAEPQELDPPTTLTGNPGGTVEDAGQGGAKKMCRCRQTTTETTGGAGGNSNAEGGGAGLPSLDGGVGGVARAICDFDGSQNGGRGAPGANGAPGKHGTQVGLGAIEPSGWVPARGMAGETGGIGQGGGGGRGCNGEGGGGGACGSCGGSGGGGGGGGGGSIALLVKNVGTLSLGNVSLETKNAGNGGDGVPGIDSEPPGVGGLEGPRACSCKGGAGGRGGHGGHGGGGAGGVSAGIVFTGQRPTLDATTIRPGQPGTGGKAGGAGAENGRDGLAKDIVEL